MYPYVLSLLAWLAPAQSDLPCRSQAPQWLDEVAGGAGGRRYALLVGVGRYSEHETWRLPWVKADLDLLAETLHDRAGFGEIIRLQDEEVSAGSIASAVQKFGSWLSGSDNVVVIYWIGHGYVDRLQESRYFLSHTREVAQTGAQPDYEYTLGETELAALLQPLRRPGQSSVILIADACRVPVMGPPTDRKPREVAIADACWYSTRRGSYAIPEPGQVHALFTATFARALADLSSGTTVALGMLSEAVQARIAESGHQQTPELWVAEPGARDLKFKDRGNLSLRIEVYDGFRRVEVQGAEIKLGDTRAESPATIRGLVEGEHPIEVAKTGYFRTIASVELDERRSGTTLRILLQPELIVLQGAIKDPAGAALQGITCRVRGDRSGFLAGYHRHEASSDADGNYRLFVPAKTDLAAIAFDRGPGQEPHAIPLELDRLLPREDGHPGGIVVRTFDLGITHLAVASASPDDLGLSGEASFVWGEAEKFITESSTDDVDLAIGYYRQVLATAPASAQEIVRDRIRTAMLSLLAHLRGRGRYAEGIERAREALQEFPGDRDFQQSLAECERENVPGELREQLRQASEARERGDRELAEQVYAQLMDKGDKLTAYYQQLVKEARTAIVDQLFQDAVARIGVAWRRGDVASAVASYLEAERRKPGNPLVEVWSNKLRNHLDVNPPSIVFLDRQGNQIERSLRTTGQRQVQITVIVQDDRGIERVVVGDRDQRITPGERECRFPIDVTIEARRTTLAVEAWDRSGQRTAATLGIENASAPLIAGFKHLRENSAGLPEYQHENTGMEFILVPSGVLEPCQSRGQRVEIAAFLMAKHEVTRETWRRVTRTDPPGGAPATRDRVPPANIPVTVNSWQEAQSFSERAGLAMPSDVQWEYACHAGSSRCPVPEHLDGIGWFARQGSGRPELHPVATRLANAWGFFDLFGNAAEWCRPSQDLQAAGDAKSRMGLLCGGSVYDSPGRLPVPRLVERARQVSFAGLRLVKDISK